MAISILPKVRAWSVLAAALPITVGPAAADHAHPRSSSLILGENTLTKLQAGMLWGQKAQSSALDQRAFKCLAKDTDFLQLPHSDGPCLDP